MISNSPSLPESVLLSQVILTLTSTLVPAHNFSSISMLFPENEGMITQTPDDLCGTPVSRPLVPGLMKPHLTPSAHLLLRPPSKLSAVHFESTVSVPLLEDLLRMKRKQEDMASSATASASTWDCSIDPLPLLRLPLLELFSEILFTGQDDVGENCSEVAGGSHHDPLNQPYLESASPLPSKPPYRKEFQDVPAEVVHRICDHLGQEDLGNFRRTSKWYLDKMSFCFVSYLTRGDSFVAGLSNIKFSAV